jgi:hypothetical protein
MKSLLLQEKVGFSDGELHEGNIKWLIKIRGRNVYEIERCNHGRDFFEIR